MRNIQELLEAERKTERSFASEMADAKPVAGGWPPGLVLHHVAVWRDVLLDALREVQRGEPTSGPPDRIDDFNAQHLTAAANVRVEDALRHCDEALVDLIALGREFGDRPFPWYVARTVSEAVVRNSYYHPRNHIAEHIWERGDRARAIAIFEETAAELQKLEAPDQIVRPALDNLDRARRNRN